MHLLTQHSRHHNLPKFASTIRSVLFDSLNWKTPFRALESTECRTTETDSYCLPATWIRYFSLALSKRSKSSNWSLLLHRVGIKHGCTLSAWLLSTKEQRSNWCKFKTKADTWLYWFRKDFWRMCEVVTQ